MAIKKALPSPISILMIVIAIAAIATWLVPAGKYNTLSYTEGNNFTLTTITNEIKLPFTQHTLDSLHINIALDKFKSGAIRKPISVPGTYAPVAKNGQGFIAVLEAPIKGIIDSIDIILFLLIVGGFMNVFHETRAIIKGLASLSHNMKGREAWLIIILFFLFSLAGSSYGMAEEALAFYPVMVPLFLAAGYDLLVPAAVIFGGTQLGTLSSFSNPFSTIIASNAAGVNWQDGLSARFILFLLSTGISIWYIVRYAQRVKKDPTRSLVYRIDGNVASPYDDMPASETHEPLTTRTKLLITLFLITFAAMVVGVVAFGWWLSEMTTLFFSAALLVAVIQRIPEKTFIKHFIKGAEDMLSVAFIVGVARGVTIILNEGRITDSILYYSAQLVGGFPPAIFILMLLVLYLVFTLFISSSSGMAVLTMPILGALAIIVNVPGREIVNTYLFGMGIMGFMTPTGLILPSLALVNVSLKAWWKFIYPLLMILLVLCSIFLVIGIFMK
jgi:uncharacterized ion transporter superfamily protein YfcC